MERRIGSLVFNIIACVLVILSLVSSSVSFQSSSRELLVLVGRVSRCCHAFKINNNNNNNGGGGDDDTEDDGGFRLSTDSVDNIQHVLSSRRRRELLLSTTTSCLGVAVLSPSSAHAAMDTKDDESTSMNTGEVSDAFPKLGSEYYIMRLLPLKNIVF